MFIHIDTMMQGFVARVLGRTLRKTEQVHHKNKNRQDNRPENLELVVNNDHYGKINCPKCNHGFLIK